MFQRSRKIKEFAHTFRPFDARIMADDLTHGMTAARVEEMAAKYTLDAEQKKALTHLAGLSGFAMLNGPAGAGKSRVLEALYHGYAADGYHVKGLALSNKVIAGMRQCGFHDASTLDAELVRMEHGRSTWTKKTLF
jgi:hypothetical protein